MQRLPPSRLPAAVALLLLSSPFPGPCGAEPTIPATSTPAAAGMPSAPLADVRYEEDLGGAAIILRFQGRPALEATSPPGSRAVVVEFTGAQYPAGARLLTRASEVLDSAGVEQVGANRVRLILKVRPGNLARVYTSHPDPTGTMTCAVIVQDEVGDIGATGAALTWPVRGRLTSRYGWRLHPILHFERMHTGVDIAVPEGTPIRSMESGVVTAAHRKGGGGLTVAVRHNNGLETSYKHCSRILVKTGDHVKRHQIIAEVGQTGLATGPHLHFTVSQDGEPVDPARYMRSHSRIARK